MAKSDKATVLRRVHEIGRLVLAGAEFAEIRQYASERGWQVSARQLRRYQEIAYRRLARAAERDHKQLLGRHLLQRRVLYARSLKANDVRAALQVLRDEAMLQGLYPPAKSVPTTPDGQHTDGPDSSRLSRRQRLARLLAAEARGDHVEQQLVQSATPYLVYRFPDTRLPLMMLHTLTLIYVSEQLDQAATLLDSLWITAFQGDPDGALNLVGLISAYRFRIGREAWQQFTQGLGVDGDYLVRSNYLGRQLERCTENICTVAPSDEEMRAVFHEAIRSVLNDAGHPADQMLTTAHLCRSWQKMFAQVGQDLVSG